MHDGLQDRGPVRTGPVAYLDQGIILGSEINIKDQGQNRVIGRGNDSPDGVKVGRVVCRVIRGRDLYRVGRHVGLDEYDWIIIYTEREREIERDKDRDRERRKKQVF